MHAKRMRCAYAALATHLRDVGHACLHVACRVVRCHQVDVIPAARQQPLSSEQQGGVECSRGLAARHWLCAVCCQAARHLHVATATRVLSALGVEVVFFCVCHQLADFTEADVVLVYIEGLQKVPTCLSRCGCDRWVRRHNKEDGAGLIQGCADSHCGVGRALEVHICKAARHTRTRMRRRRSAVQSQHWRSKQG